MGSKRILIVEDEYAVGRGLEYGLKKEGFEVAWATNGSQALRLAHDWLPDLLVLDLRLPDVSGFEVCRQLRAERFFQPILMLTARDEEIDRVLGLELGADDYVVKPYSLRELISRIHAHLRRTSGEYAQAGGLLSFGEIAINPVSMQVSRAGRLVELTPIEFKLLYFLAGNPNRPFSRDALIEAVWGYDSPVVDDRTIDVHVRHLREKLENDPACPRWLITVRGFGYKFDLAGAAGKGEQ